MTGPEHYREAERLLASIASELAEDGADEGAGIGEWAVIAQAHATLALAAATAVYDSTSKDAWREVAS